MKRPCEQCHHWVEWDSVAFGMCPECGHKQKPFKPINQEVISVRAVLIIILVVGAIAWKILVHPTGAAHAEYAALPPFSEKERAEIPEMDKTIQLLIHGHVIERTEWNG